MSRRRPSGVGSNSQRFAEIRMPDGRKAKVPAAKDAATFFCVATPDGRWPSRAEMVTPYDVTHLTEGTTFTHKEMRPGHGMGTLRPYTVVESQVIVEQHEGSWIQLQRWLLIAPAVGGDELNDLDADALDGRHG